MKVLDRMPHELASRAHRNSIPVECDCGVMFAAITDARTLAPDATTIEIACPSCKTRGTIPRARDPRIGAQIAEAQKDQTV